MSRFLLDTHIVIFALRTPEKLSEAAHEALLSGDCVISVAVYWEVVVKTMKGALDVGDPSTWWRRALDALAASQIFIDDSHVRALLALPAVHKDPFDRILIAQAIAEDLTLISTDKAIQRYREAGLQVIS